MLKGASKKVGKRPEYWNNPIQYWLLLFGLLLMVLSSACAAAATEAPDLAPPAETEEPVEEPSISPPLATSTLPGFSTQLPQPILTLAAPSLAPTPSAEIMPAVPENRRIDLEWPTKIRKGDPATIRLALEMDDLGNLTPTAHHQGSQVESKAVGIPNLYETHYVVVEAELIMLGMPYRPSGKTRAALEPGMPLTFVWHLRPDEIGKYPATIWLRLKFRPKDGGMETERVLVNKYIEMEVVNFLGLGGTAARVLGSVGIVVGSVIGIEDLLSWTWKLMAMWRKSKS